MSQNSQKLNRSQKRISKKLERIVSGVSENQATVVKTTEPKEEQEEPKRVLKTIITETWEVFDEDPDSNGIGFSNIPGKQLLGKILLQLL